MTPSILHTGSELSIITTEDGSHTLYVPSLDEHYHSTHGAFQESQHVFINMGLAHSPYKSIKVLEIGFGTGLNALLAWKYAAEHQLALHYTSIEKYPIEPALVNKLNYGSLLEIPWGEHFNAIHSCNWEQDIILDPHFTLHKLQADLQTSAIGSGYQLVFFDAFAPEKQPELWTQAIFDKIYSSMATGGILTTYCAKGIVKRTLKAAGFTLESLPGPPGKREMTRAIKP